MPKYIVSTMIQAPDNEPVHVYWYRGDDLARAVSAMASAAVHDNEVDDSNMPPSARYRTLGVTLSIEQQQPEPEPAGWCNSHEGRHTFTDGSDGDEPCVGWRTEADMVRATGSTVTFDTETHPLRLSECVYYDRPKRDLPKWAYGDCGGPRVGIVQGGEANGIIMCEKHFNEMPRN